MVPSSASHTPHIDTTPPFDVTLDICVDHEGDHPRPINFVRKIPGRPGGMGVETLCLQPGESAIFFGSQLPHFGGDLPERCLHTVLLCTWQLGLE